MARSKKAVKVASAPVVEEVKVAAEVTEVKEAVVTEAKEEAAEKPAAKNTAKKAPAKKTVEKTEEPVNSTNVYLQYCGKQFSEAEIIEKAKEAAAAEGGFKRVSSIKSIDIYCKPEEHAAYYVANGGKIVGRIDL